MRHGQALRMALTRATIDAEEAHRMGLMEYLVGEDKHLEKALEVAGRMERWSPVALSLVKRSVGQALEAPLSARLAYEKDLFLAAFASEGGREGVRAFMEKRPPNSAGG